MSYVDLNIKQLEKWMNGLWEEAGVPGENLTCRILEI